jgi:hypothetical protein
VANYEEEFGEDLNKICAKFDEILEVTADPRAAAFETIRYGARDLDLNNRFGEWLKTHPEDRKILQHEIISCTGFGERYR